MAFIGRTLTQGPTPDAWLGLVGLARGWARPEGPVVATNPRPQITTIFDIARLASPFQLGTDTFIPTTRATADSRKFTVLVWNAKPDELTWQTNPSAKFLGQLQSGNVTKLVFQLDKVDPSIAMLDVTVQKKGAAEAMKASVPMAR